MKQPPDSLPISGMVNVIRFIRRQRFLEFSKKWGLVFEFYYTDSPSQGLHFCFIFGSIHLRLPARLMPRIRQNDFYVRYGFSWHWDAEFGDTIFLGWGSWRRSIYMPWHWVFIRHSILMDDGSWRTLARGEWRKPANAHTETHPYLYVLENGECQARTATIGVEEWEHRRWFLKWTRFLSRVRRSITVKFNDEVGERTGSWKGGCVGCGYDIRPGERPIDTLRRMERERKF